MKYIVLCLPILGLSISTGYATPVDPAVQMATVAKAALADEIAPERVEATPQQMAGIWYSLKAAADENGRIAVLSYVAKNYWLRAVQVEVLVQIIADDQKRAEMIAALYPRMMDKGSVDNVLKLVPSGVQRDTLIRQLKGIQVATL